MSDSIISTLKNGVRTIQLNRPKVLNALNGSMYLELRRILNEDANNDMVVLTILTAVGNYFSSGRDMAENPNTDSKAVENFMSALIDYPKLLIAVVNGPAYGVGVTILGLCDVVYASDRATFSTPFVPLGITPEACSTYTFPRMLGRSKASEMLLLGMSMTVQEALGSGLISKIIPHHNLKDFIEDLHKFGQLPRNTLKNAKDLIMAPIRQQLHETLERDIPQLCASFESPEFLKARATLLTKRNKL